VELEGDRRQRASRSERQVGKTLADHAMRRRVRVQIVGKRVIVDSLAP